MTEEERRELFRACVQAGAVVAAIRQGRPGAVAIDVIAGAWRVPATAIPTEAHEAAIAYLDWQCTEGPRPAWLP